MNVWLIMNDLRQVLRNFAVIPDNNWWKYKDALPPSRNKRKVKRARFLEIMINQSSDFDWNVEWIILGNGINVFN